MIRPILLGTALVLTSLTGAAASAAALTFAFTGTVAFVDTSPADPFGGAVGFGTPFQGTYSFPATASDLAPGDPQTGTYTFAGPPAGAILEFEGGPTFDFTRLNVAVNDDFPTGDLYTVSATTSSFDPFLGLTFRDDTGDVFPDDALPAEPPPFGTWSSTELSLEGSDVQASQVEIVGSVGSLECVEGCAVPEPGALLLVGAGLAWVSLRREESTS